jgi:hypothetical protein
LDALVAVYAIEFLFVACPASCQRFVEPFASFDGGVLADLVVLLLPEGRY